MMDDPMTLPCLPGHLPEDPVHLLSLKLLETLLTLHTILI